MLWDLPQESWTVEPVPQSAGIARRRALRAARLWCPLPLTEPYEDRIMLVISELVTNAVRHAGDAGPITVSLWLTPRGNFAVVVSDGSSQPPVWRKPGADEESGRGLALVAKSSIAWEWRRRSGGGKSVHATLPLPGSLTVAERAKATAAAARRTVPGLPVARPRQLFQLPIQGVA
ncbi:ATP-binding protein [Kitasatospora sp. NPDC056076]|uniref:ATP-binding protein n=1 Tax=Kitasatospora sp. NPDC056076 TaxID=3345703 RepID=UPI0035E06B56